MPNQVPISDFRALDETNRSLLVWQGLSDTWTKLMETIDHQKEIEADTRVHQKLLITGNGEPSLMERVRNLESFASAWKYWMRFIGGALIIQTITFGFAVAIAVIRFLPLLEALAKKP